ncbi:beta-1,6-N-acetylglucosaminyltransferase [Mediterraneibacter gnavus]|uniref:beta-1,6-N-acetylglucosaminyltransferase n=1 Tax=Mediterraneibacter gnavus TaxID=33038 RepID=UPI0032B7F0A0
MDNKSKIEIQGKIKKNKHAYLIIAHKDNDTLKSLIEMIDDAHNDIYLHMDKKNSSYNPSEIEKIVKKSNIFHTRRTNVKWGGYSLVNAELILFEMAASKGKYKYYHLISGEDLPLKSQEEIHDYFDKNGSKEYVGFFKESPETIENRYRKYHFFQEYIGRNSKSGLKDIILRKMEELCLKIQKIGGEKWKRNADIQFYKGSQWVSITDDFVRYILSNMKRIKKIYKYTIIPDESFIQTIAMNSYYKNKLSTGNENEATMRLIDWERGNPYIYKKEDLLILRNCDSLFARKFSDLVDKEIIIELKKNVISKDSEGSEND